MGAGIVIFVLVFMLIGAMAYASALGLAYEFGDAWLIVAGVTIFGVLISFIIFQMDRQGGEGSE